MDTGEELRVNAEEQTATASTIKVPILIELFRQVDEGTVDLDTRLTLSQEARTVGSGILRELSPGLDLTLRDYATLMIVVSDNIATNVLIDLLGIDRINQTMAEFGFSQTKLRGRSTSQNWTRCPQPGGHHSVKPGRHDGGPRDRNDP